MLAGDLAVTVWMWALDGVVTVDSRVWMLSRDGEQVRALRGFGYRRAKNLFLVWRCDETDETHSVEDLLAVLKPVSVEVQVRIQADGIGDASFVNLGRVATADELDGLDRELPGTDLLLCP